MVARVKHLDARERQTGPSLAGVMLCSAACCTDTLQEQSGMTRQRREASSRQMTLSKRLSPLHMQHWAAVPDAL